MLAAFPASRRHTLHFLSEARDAAPVHLTCEVDAARLDACRQEARAAGTRRGMTAMIVLAIARVFARHPDLNVGIVGRLSPALVRYPSVVAKVTVDKRDADGTRLVASTTIPGADRMTLDDLDGLIASFKSADFASSDAFARIRKLQALPVWLGGAVYRMIAGRSGGRQGIHGSFSVTSLGSSAVRGFFPFAGGSYTFGIGAIHEGGRWTGDGWAPVRLLPLTMSFDHRLCDGALAAEVLGEIKAELEAFAP